MTDLFEYAKTAHALEFGGATYDERRDGKRLQIQLERVRSIMLPGEWLTLNEISERMGGAPTASISARLRDLRKFHFGGYDVQRRYRERGLWEYHVELGGTPA